MSEPRTDRTWLVVLDRGDGGTTERKVKAAYHRFAEDQPFIEFKTVDHKLVFTVAAARVIMIGREPQQ